MKDNKLNNKELIESIAARCPIEPVQYMLVKRLDTTYIKVKKDLPDPTNPKNANLQPGDEGYTYKRVVEKEPAMFQKGVIIKLDLVTLTTRDNPAPGQPKLPYQIGDVILFHERACMPVDILPGIVMVRPYDIQGRWLTEVELANNATERNRKKGDKAILDEILEENK